MANASWFYWFSREWSGTAPVSDYPLKMNESLNLISKWTKKECIWTTDNDVLTLSVKLLPPCKNSSRTLWPYQRNGKAIQGNCWRTNFQRCKKEKKKKRKGIMTDTLNFPGMTIFGGARNWMCCSVLTKLCEKNANVSYELLLWLALFSNTNWQYKHNQKLKDTYQTIKTNARFLNPFHQWEIVIKAREVNLWMRTLALIGKNDEGLTLETSVF